MASPTVLEAVAPVTKAPLCAALSPNSPRSQPAVSRSRAVAQESAALITFWSHVVVSQSPASAAGVDTARGEAEVAPAGRAGERRRPPLGEPGQRALRADPLGRQGLAPGRVAEADHRLGQSGELAGGEVAGGLQRQAGRPQAWSTRVKADPWARRSFTVSSQPALDHNRHPRTPVYLAEAHRSTQGKARPWGT